MSPSPKKPSDSEDPWENLAEQLFGTTPGKEHTAANETRANETRSSEVRKEHSRKDSRPLESLLASEESAEQVKKKKSLADLLFDDESSDTADEGAPPGEEPAAPVRAASRKPLLDDDDDAAAEAPESGLELPAPKPASVSPQDSYWDALANWSWDDGDSSKSAEVAAEPTAERSEAASEEESRTERAPAGRGDRSGRGDRGGRRDRGGSDRGGRDRGGRDRGERDRRGRDLDQGESRSSSDRGTREETPAEMGRDVPPAAQAPVSNEPTGVPPIWDFEAEEQAPPSRPARSAGGSRPSERSERQIGRAHV